jgi:hypothetical protein
MNKNGEIELRDFVALFLIYILILTTVATSSNISISDNSSLPSPKKTTEPEIENTTSPQEEETPENSTSESDETTNQTTPDETTNQTTPDETTNQTTPDEKENTTEETNQTTPKTKIPLTNQTSQENQSIENQTNQISSKNVTTEFNQTIQEIDETTNESEPRIELIQGPAIIGEKVIWTKKVYTNNSDYKIKIPDEAKELTKTIKIKTENLDSQEISFGITQDSEENHIEIIYETPAPGIEEKELEFGKEILVYSDIHYENVLAFTNLNETLGIRKPNQIKINWVEENQEITPTKLTDTNGDRIYDYIEWVVPHLSNQTFQIILVTSAQHLDENRTFISNIYDEIKSLDDIWSETIFSEEFVRITFEKNLTSTNDITIYPRIISGNPSIEVYEKNQDTIIAEFNNITEGKNKIILHNLQEPQDAFDLKIINGSLQFDQIIDPDYNPQTCSGFWGWDCATGPPETGGTGGDNTFDSCSTGLGADESVENIYINATAVYAGETISVTCEFDPYTGSDDTFIWYYNGTGWRKIFEHLNWGAAVITNETVEFTTDDVIGAHWVRCGINYGTGTDTDQCMDSTSYYDNDDISFEVEAQTFTSPSPPNSILCNGGSCSITIDENLNINASGSIDPEGDAITYSIEASSTQNTSLITNNTDTTQKGFQENIFYIRTDDNGATNTGGTATTSFTAMPDTNYAALATPLTDDDTIYSSKVASKAVGSTNWWMEDDQGNNEATNFMYAAIQHGHVTSSSNNIECGSSTTAASSYPISFATAFPNTNYAAICNPLTDTDSPICIINDATGKSTSGITFFLNDDGGATEAGTGIDWCVFQHGEYNIGEVSIKSGSQAVTNGAMSVNLATAFPDTNYVVFITDATSYAADGCACEVTARNAGSFTALCEDDAASSANCDETFDWVAIERGDFDSYYGATQEKNTTEITYENLALNHKTIQNITITVEVDSYNPSASVNQATTKPDLWLEMYNGVSWVSIGALNLPSIYTGTTLNTTNANFSTLITDSQMLTAWKKIENQDIRIKGIYFDHNETLPDEINYTNIFVQIEGKIWYQIGNHTQATQLTWDTTSVPDQTGIDLRARAIDPLGGNTYSGYYTKGSSLTIDHIYPAISFQGNTQESGSALSQNYIHINVTVNETNPSNITYSLYNSTDFVSSSTFEMQDQNSNTTFDFTYLPNDVYTYNVTIYDEANHANSTETRTITLDSIDPEANFPAPSSNTHSKSMTQNLSINATDNMGLKEAILYIFNSSGFLINTTSVLISGTAVTIGVVYEFLTEGLYEWFYRIIDVADRYYDSPNNTIVIDTTSPNITLESPLNNSGDKDGNLQFNYNITDSLSEITNCTLILDEIPTETNTTITKNTIQSITQNGLGLGFYNWSISCYDEAENQANSSTKYFYVVNLSSFDGSTTDLSTVDMNNVSDFTLEISNYGKIHYNEDLNLAGILNFDSLVSIGQSGVFVDSVSEIKLNKSATIEFYNLTYEFLPVILKDDKVCTNCPINYYTNGNFSFNVTSFSSYNLSENSKLEVNYESTVLQGTATDLRFFANYTNTTSEQSIDSGICNITIDSQEYEMTYNSSIDLFEYNQTFSSYGIYDYEVSCFGSSLGYENLNVQDYAVVEFQEDIESDRIGYLTQNGIYNFAGTDEFIPLTQPILNLSKAFIIASNQMNQENTAPATSGDPATNSDDSFVSLYLYNSTHIRAQRAVSDDGPVVVAWQVLEAGGNEFTVQRGSTSYSGTSLTVNDTIPTPVNTTNSMSWFYIQTTYTGNNGDSIQFFSNITDPTTIQFTRATGTSTFSVDFRWEVIEWNRDKINNFAKGYTDGITGPDTAPDCFSIGTTINKSSSILFHQSNSLHLGTGGLDSSTRAGYIQDDNTVCFYDYASAFTAGVKWFVVDFKDATSREENAHTDWGTTDYRDDITFSNTYDTNTTLFWLSGTCNGDGAAKPRHTQWWNISSSGFTVERTYGGQNREYSWQVLGLSYYENLDVPQFFNPSVNTTFAANSEIIRFTIDVNDSSDSINITKGIIAGIERDFTAGLGDSWYYDYTCTGNEEVPFLFVLAYDNGQIQRSNGTLINGISATCDSTAPIVSFISPDTPLDSAQTKESFFDINLTITEPNFQEVSYELYNSTGLLNKTTYLSKIENIKFTDLTSGTYYYNVTVKDLAGNTGSTETRSVIFDNDAPQISYGTGIYQEGSIVSSTQIFVNVTITEPNFKNVTFFLYNEFMTEERTPVTYTDSTRSLSWTLLDDGLYFYNVLAYDTLGNFNSTEIRNVTLDSSAPIVIFETGTAPDDSYFSTDGIFVNVSYTEPHFKNITFNLYNNTGLVDSQSPIANEYQFGPLVSAEYYYNVTVCDLAQNCGTSQTRKITLDQTNPIVDFAPPTESDNYNVSRNWLFINASITEPNFKNITFSLYDNNYINVNSTAFSDGTKHINFTNLASNIYYYNISVYDKAGNLGISPTRRIGLDTLGPAITITSPQPKAYSNGTNIPINYTVIDLISNVSSCWHNLDGGSNTTVNCTGSSSLTTTDGSHTLYFFANDSFGNVAKETVSFLVSTTGPAIQLTNPENDTFYPATTKVSFNYTSSDPDLTSSCSLYGSWNGGWHKNQTDLDWIRGDTGNIFDNFEVISGWNWTQGTTDNCDWSRNPNNDGTPSGNTGPEADHTLGTIAGHFLFIEASSGQPCAFDAPGGSPQAFLESPILEAGKNHYNISFWFHMYGAGMGSLYLEVNDGSGWSPIWSQIGQYQTAQANPYVYVSRDLSMYSTNITLRLRSITGSAYTSDMAIDDLNISYVPGSNKPMGNFTVNLSEEGNYIWNVECNDTLGFSGWGISNYTIGLDTTDPQVDFGTGTPTDASRTGLNSIYVNASITESNLNNVTFNLYKSGSLVGTTIYSNGITNHTFNGLTEGIYYYNISAQDKAGRTGNSPTRSIELDLTPPTGSLISPGNGYFTRTKIQNLTATVSDLIELKDAVLFIYNSTGGLVYSSLISLTGMTSALIGVVYEFLYDDVFSWFYQITDSVNNTFNTTANNIEIDSIAPLITMISPTEANAQIVLRNWIFINVSVYEKNYGNITFWLYNSEGIKSPSPNTFSDSTREINYTLLPDDVYYYNITSFDTAGNNGSSETRSITLDTTLPVLNFVSPTKTNNSFATGTSITLNLTATEANEKNITFNLYNGTNSIVRQNTFLDGRRTITWTLLSEGEYFYNTTMFDEVEQSGSTETRKITLDNTAPIINYESPTENTNANKSQNWIFINTSVVENNFENITFYLYNSAGLLSTKTFTNQTREYNFTGLSNQVYYYNVTTFDKAAQFSSTSTRKITLDTISPTISFVSPTETNGVIRNRNWVFINTSVTDTNFKQITFSIYDSGGLRESQTFTDTTRSYNFTELPDENYQYNVTAIDFSGNTNSTETRNIGLDSSGPIVNIIKPRPKTYGYNTSLPLEHTVSDLVSSVDSCWWNLDNGANQSITCGTPTTFNTSVAPHTLYFFANDTFGNVGTDSVSFFISITGPAIELINPSNASFFPSASIINFSFSSFDPDGVDSCSLYGDWSGTWQKNESYSGNWQDVAFKSRREINITNIAGSTLTDFPVYLNISSSHTETSDYADLAFFSGTCESPGSSLDYEIEDYNSNNANIWIKIPSLVSGVNTICMYYKNPDAESIENPASVWSASYTSVYHLDHTSGTAFDSLGNFDAEDGITPDSNMNTLGKIGGADYFDGSDYLGTNPEWDVDGAHTYCAWVKFSINHDGTILEDGGLTDGTGMGITSTGEFRYAECYNGAFNAIDSGTSYSDDSWHYVCGGHEGAGGNQFLYVDGELISAVTQGDGISGTDNARIGQAVGANPLFDDNLAHGLIGTLDEIRVSSTFRNSDWINQSYQQITNYDSNILLSPEENFTAFQIPFSEEGTYLWNIECNDTIGYSSFGLNNYTFIVDVTDPQVFFGAGTESNNANVGRNWVFVDANIIENNFKNITFKIYNSTGLVDFDTFTDSTRQTNFTNLASGIYHYNITVYDKADHAGYSETRQINLDLTPPTGSLDTPLNNSYLGELSQNLKATFSDATGLFGATLYVLNATGHIIYSEFVDLMGAQMASIGVIYNFLSEGIYSWFYSVEDIVGNKFNTTSNTLTIDTTHPLIDFTTGTEESGQIFQRENIFVNVTSSDTYWANLTFNLYDSSGIIFSNTITDGTKEINWTFLPDATYFYNVTARDIAGNENTTETRNITLDNLNPVISFVPPTLPSGSFSSGDNIYLNVSVIEANEANITFYLYNATGHNIKTNTYTNKEREITWNLIPEGTYFYNATIIDKVGRFASTLTRSVILDNTFPQLEYGFGVLPNNTHIKQSWIFSSAVLTEDNFQNITFNLYNSSGTINQSTFTDTTRQLNFTNLIDGNYRYDITSCDKASNCNITETRYITLDSVNPTIEFVSPTENNNFNKTANWIFINTTVGEINFANITFYLYDSNGIINQSTFTDNTRSINFTNLQSKVYWYNVTTSDFAGNKNSTEERKIGIDYLGPSITITNPKAKAYGYNISLPLNYIVSDNIVGLDTCWYNLDNEANTTVDCLGSSTFDTSDGSHTLHFFANDTFNNIGYKNVTFLISTTGPAIQLLLPEDDTFYSESTEVFFNYTAEDPDLTASCSLYGSWNGGWHLNQTDLDWIIGDSGNVFDNFEVISGWNWTQGSGDDCDWSRNANNDGTPSGTTGPEADHTLGTIAGHFLFIEASSGQPCAYDAPGGSPEAFLESPSLDADTNDYNVSFWFHMYGSAMGNLYLEVNDGSDWTPIWSQIGQNQTAQANPYIYVSRSLADYEGTINLRFRSITGSNYQSDMAIDDLNISYVPAGNKPSGNFTLNLSEEGTHKWNVLCNDTIGYLTSAVSNFSITFDVTNPIVDFGTNTLPDNSNVSQNFIYINSSITENNYANMTFFLYNSSGLVATHFQNDTTYDYTFLNLPDGTYFYNITVYDLASRQGSSPTRKILLDTKAPTGSQNTPTNNLITNNQTQNLTGTFSDENGLEQIILYIFNSTGLLYSTIIPLSGALSATVGVVYEFLTDGIYKWFFQAEDTIGNIYNTTNFTLTIDTTPPQINFIPTTLPSNTFTKGNNIFVNTSIIETNFKNVTFDLFNGEGIFRSYTFTNSKRDINYTLLPDDEYFYSVTSSDLANNTNTSELRTITLDNIPPTSSYVSPTQLDTANKSQNWIYINTSTTELNFANITFQLYLGETPINTTTYQTKTEYINFTGLSDGTYSYNATITDKAGQSFTLPSRKITLDTTNPILFFIAETQPSGTVLEQEFVYMNTFLTETNFKNITFYIYDNTSLLNATTFLTKITEISFSVPGINKTYFYNVTTFDTAGNYRSTETRNITLIDTTYPTLSITSPQNKTYTYNTSLRINYDVYDLHLEDCWYNLNSGPNITMPNCQSVVLDVADEQAHTIKVFANDTMGYTASDNVTFFVNSSLINLPETYSVQRGTIFTDGTSTQPITEIHPTKGFIIHTVRSGDSSPSTLQVTSDFSDPEEIIFKNYESGAGAAVDWSLVAGPNITVQRGEIPYTNELSLSLSISPVNLSNSFIIVNNRLNTTTTSQNIDGFWTGKFIDDSNANFTRSSNLASGVLSYQIVSWTGSTAQSGDIQISNTNSISAETISQVNPNQTFMIFSRRSTDTTIQNSMSKGEIKNSTALEFSRVGSTGTLNIEWFTLESPIFSSQHGNHTHLVSSSPQYAQIPNPLINITRSFDIHSNDNAGTATSFATSSLTQNIYNKTAVVLQKGVAVGTGITFWSAIEIKELDSPQITLEFPLNHANISGTTIESFNFSIADESLILNCSLYGNWSGGWHLNKTIQSPTTYTTINFSSLEVEPDNYYIWNVKCIDAYGNIGWNSENFSLAAFYPPTKPVLYNITQDSNDGQGNITLSWTESDHSTKYEIYSGLTIPTMTYLAETNDLNYTDFSFKGEKRRFYQVRATNPIGQNSSGIFGAHLYELEHNTVKSQNWIAFPSNFSYLKNANETLLEIPQSTGFTTFNSTTQSRVTCNEFSCPESFGCTATNCNFNLLPGRSYEVTINTSLSQKVNWSGVGKIHEIQTISLTKNATSFGKNWIALQPNTTLTNAQGLIGSIPNADALSRWNCTSQYSEGLIPSPFPWLPGFIGKNFQLNLEEGYEVSVTSSTTWQQN